MAKQTLTERLHERMHDLPGMPAHEEAERLNHGGRLGGDAHALANRPHANRSFHNAPARHQREPRVLVGWQKAIAAFFARLGS
jgi:hypothetical protein